jgi:hypothetical protein
MNNQECKDSSCVVDNLIGGRAFGIKLLDYFLMKFNFNLKLCL